MSESLFESGKGFGGKDGSPRRDEFDAQPPGGPERSEISGLATDGHCDGAGRRRGDEKQRSENVREQRKGARTGVDSAGIQSACSLN